MDNKTPTHRSYTEINELSESEFLELSRTAPFLLEEEPNVLSFLGTRPNVRLIRSDVVVKINDIDPSELHHMELVQSQTSIPVPRIIRYVQSACDASEFLALQYIPGMTLEKRWPTLSIWRKLWVLWKLRSYIRQLRRIRTKPVEVPGPVGPEPTICRSHIYGEGPWRPGPFASYSEMVSWFERKLALAQRMGHAPVNVAPFDSSEPLVFTHQDLHMRNLIYGDDGQLWMLDWDTAGFYPKWFEYASMSRWTRTPWLWRAAFPFVAGGYAKQAAFLRAAAWSFEKGRGIKV